MGARESCPTEGRGLALDSGRDVGTQTEPAQLQATQAERHTRVYTVHLTWGRLRGPVVNKAESHMADPVVRGPVPGA